MAKGFNWARAAKERVIRERGHEALSPDDHTLRKGIPAPRTKAGVKAQKAGPAERNAAQDKAVTCGWAKPVKSPQERSQQVAKEVEAAKARAKKRAKRRAAHAAAQAEAKALRLAKAAKKRANREAKLAATPPAQGAAIERRRALHKDARLRGVIVERKRPPRSRAPG